MNREEMLKRLKSGEAPLEISIRKWQDIVDGVGEDMHSDNCALCEVNDDLCDSCVIFIRTGHTCHLTPYFRYLRNPCTETAQAELDFLKSLRE